MPDTYALTRDATESQRLTSQHAVWKTNIGFLLHPRIAQSLPHKARIGDVGTGTGAWIIELAETLNQKHEYDGLDISSTQFPAANSSVVRFSILNILDPIPEHLKGVFDVLHLRLLILGLPGGSWELASRNLLEMLRPGGWVQWEEADFSIMQTLQTRPGASTTAAKHLLEKIFQVCRTQGLDHEESLRLGETLRRGGFGDVIEDVFSSDRVAETRAAFTATIMGALGAYVKMFALVDLEGTLRDALEELADRKAYYRAELRVVTGRKAS